jgi:hypothetical protein
MIDAEVMRLRRLRNAALKARALAAALDPDPGRRSSVFSRSAVNCWRIARVVTGWLRAHPYLSYQRGPSAVRDVYDRLGAGLLSAVAQSQGRSLQALSRELQRVARGLDDARALTWSSELSDTLGRAQIQIRTLIKELDSDTRDPAASRHETLARVDTRAIDGRRALAGRQDAGSVTGTWPYLAI